MKTTHGRSALKFVVELMRFLNWELISVQCLWLAPLSEAGQSGPVYVAAACHPEKGRETQASRLSIKEVTMV